MASQIERRIAASVFRLQKSGSNVPPDVRAAARRVLQGQNSTSDVESIRSFLGIRKSGSKAINRAVRSGQRVQGIIFSVSRDVESIQAAQSSGRDASIATGRLINNINSQVQRAIKTKWARQAAEGAAKLFGKDPVIGRRILLSLGRGLRLGGLVGTAVQLGFSAAGKILNTSKKATDARSKLLSFRRSQFIQAEGGRERELQAQQEIESTTGLLAGIREGAAEFFGREGAISQRVRKTAEKREESLVRTRKLVSQIEGNISGKIASFAAKQGKTVEELTDRERVQVIDEAVKGQVGRESLKTDPRIRRQLDREFSFKGLDLVTLSKLKGVFAFQTVGQILRERRDVLVTELIDVQIKSREQKLRDAQEQFRQLREHRTGVEQFQHRERLDFARATWNSFRSRHKAWSND